MSATITHTPIGRFAPSPTGPLHFGSLITALASYLNVKSKNGRWLVRIEDLDPPREDPRSPAQILKTLKSHALDWDGEIIYQATRHEPYLLALEDLIQINSTYPCSCTRRIIEHNGIPGKNGIVYPGSCRKHPLNPNSLFYSWRVVTHDEPIEFTDLRLGHFSHRLESRTGDYIIKRSDGFYAYSLAVAVDDYFQGITEVVRGEDLFKVTPRQIHLQQLLGYPTPDYLHLPLALHANGDKLSKQTHAPAIDNQRASRNLFEALQFLGQNPPVSLAENAPKEIIDWGLKHWDISLISAASDVPEKQQSQVATAQTGTR